MLSRTGWNNVVIFAMLLMIFFLNGFHNKLFNKDEPLQVVPLLPEASFVLAAALPGVKVERIGTSWRSDGIWQTDASHISAWLSEWTDSAMQTIATPADKGEAISAVQFWLAGQELPFVHTLYQHDEQYYLYDKQRQVWLLLSKTQVSQLFLPIGL
jgi:hypothetical protein